MLRTPGVALGLVAVGVLVGGCGGGDGNAGLQEAESFQTFDLYYVGGSFHGLPLTTVVRGSGRGSRRSWSFIYGSCEAGNDEGCAPPLEVQDQSICNRYPALFGNRQPELAPYRGARIAKGSAELYTRTTTIVIYGKERAAALHALRQVNDSGAAVERFRAPSKRALDGKLACQQKALHGGVGPDTNS